MAKSFDAIIIGSGQSGNPLAKLFAEKKWKVAVVEENYVGGSCINYGCTPSKTMAASARIAYTISKSSVYGIHSSSLEVNMKEVYDRKKKTVESFRSGVLKSIDHKNITLFRGTASFINSKTIKVQSSKNKSELIEADKIFINTGSRPAIPQIKGLNEINYLDSTSIMELKEVPEHLLIIGGGYVGLEFAQMFKRFGSKVTIIQRGSQLLFKEDKDVANEVLNILQEDGINIYLASEVKEVSSSESKKKSKVDSISLMIQNSKGTKKLKASHLLIATGHAPNIDKLNLAAAGIKVDKKNYIITNHKLETNVKGIYALGDVKGGPAFTHISYDDFRILRDNILNKKNESIKGRMIPYVVFIDPQLGRVGINEKEAKEKQIKYSVVKMQMKKVSRAIELNETRGFIKVLIDKKTEKILGCTVLGFEGGELMAMIQIAMLGNLKYSVLKEAIFAHPTFAESLNNLFSKVS